jgi:O-antigen/teichoic acid export membrane protein
VTTPLPSGRSAARNGFWALASQLSNLLFNGLFAIVLAQFVSVSEFGVFNYAISLASLGMAVMSAGLYGLAIREYHSHPELSSRITGSVILIREVMATCAYVVLLVVSASSAGPAAFTGAAIACLGILARVFDAPELWFQANLKAKTPAIVKISVACVFFGARLVILFAEPNVFLILALFAAEQLFNAVAIFFFYLRATPHRPRLSLSLRGTRALARQSMPLMISTIANQVNLKSDMVFIQALMGSTSVGLYAAASRISEILYTLPTTYMNATFPRLLAVRRLTSDGGERYKRELQRALDGAFWLGVAFVVIVYFSSDAIVAVLFGTEYMQSAEVLRIHVLACPFVFMAAVFSKWIIAENKLWLSLGRHIAGAVIAIGLNLLLIPQMGITGSAYATVLSYASASYFFCFFTPSTRGIGLQMTLTIVAPFRIARRLITRNEGKRNE